MSIRHLDKAFAPKSVALIGASERPGSVGAVMTANLLNSGFAGPVWLVNPKYTSLRGVPCYPSVECLPAPPDLAVIATPPQTVPGLIAELGAKGTRAAVVITAGIREQGLQQAMLDAARPYCLRIIGPNGLGLLVPGAGLNASFGHMMPEAGRLAFVSQSGALIGAVLDWAAARHIGFSAMVSMGDMADVDVGDMLDYLAADMKTQAILMYLEQVTNAPKFMSAARSASRVKPVIVIKAGRHEAAAKAAKSHTGALAGSDEVYNAAFRRAGLVRVDELEDLFDAAETLCRTRLLSSGGRLGVVTNGGGAGVLAVDRLLDCGGELAVLSPATMEKLDAALPGNWSKGNPVDIIGDADARRYEAALAAVVADPSVDALLVMNCPTALASNEETAKATIKVAEGTAKPFLTSWMGEKTAAPARAAFEAAGIPTYETPDDAIRAFTFLTSHYKAQAALMRTPPALPPEKEADRKRARQVIEDGIAKNREFLSEWASKTVLSAYGIPVVQGSIVRRWDEVANASRSLMAGPVHEVVVKILSPDITHKSDVGGVVLGLPNPEAAEKAAHDMYQRVKKLHPQARIEGFDVQAMIRRRNARELIVGVAEDATFGPVILFGAGGTAVEVIRDRAIGLPPLDLQLAHDLIAQTQVFRALQAYRNLPAANIDAIAQTLVKLSQLVADCPEISTLDINPLLADESGVLALDARIAVKKAAAGRDGLNPRLAIRPYPQQWEGREKLHSGTTILMRPIRPEDERLYDAFLKKVNPDDLRRRLFSSWQNLSHEFLARLTQIDYARAMAFVALDPATGELLGVSRLMADPDYQRAEFAVLVRSDRQRQGIGFALMRRLTDYARNEGIPELWAHVLQENAAMLAMCREFGFELHAAPGDPSVVEARLDLSTPAESAKKLVI